MICFRDRAFCSARCATAECPRRWTYELQQAARAWWENVEQGDPSGEPAPVDFMNFGPMCPEYRQPNPDREDHRVLEPGEANP